MFPLAHIAPPTHTLPLAAQKLNKFDGLVPEIYTVVVADTATIAGYNFGPNAWPLHQTRA
jgi:hypothetical protein